LVNPEVPNINLVTSAERFRSLSPDQQIQALNQAYDKAFDAMRAGRISRDQFERMVTNTLNGEQGEIFRRVLESRTFSRVREAKSAVEGALGTQTWRDRITDPVGDLLPNPR